MITNEASIQKKPNTVNYKGYLIREMNVSTGCIFKTEYIISGSGQAYQVVDPPTGLVLGTYTCLEKARQE